MKKIIISVAVATMALSTAAAALEDIKVSGQAKLWYETNNQQDNDMFGNKNQAPGTDADKATSADGFGTSAQMAFTVGVTGKQGNVGFGATFIQTSGMGLDENIASSTKRTTNGKADSELYTSEMYITLPAMANTTLKIGKQKINTPLAFSEAWNVTPVTFDAALAINKSIDNLTLVAAYIGTTNAGTNFKTDGEVDNSFHNGAQALVAHYKTKPLAVNAYYYNLSHVGTAAWLDASTSLSGVKVTGIAAKIMPKGANEGGEDTTAYAISGATKVSSVSLSAAYSTVSDKGQFAMGNFATGFKKTKLPTAGVYTDGLYVAQPGSDAMKVKAVTKVGGVKLIAQAVRNSNNITASKETTELDFIIVNKIGDVNLKTILLDRSFKDAQWDKDLGGQHVRIIASVNF